MWMVSFDFYSVVESVMTISVLLAAVIVSTPQDLAMSDVRKGIAMFRKLSVPVSVSA